ncbi:DegV family protein [Lacticaseibacillus parakribbianus]|uniref:DegV family protein n=1 Tax=Lacticaseibacillus parakribbianus TaxID=2970927 RepID=UPI0021CB8C3A|nr:DegV family protein [Lacticaseibacillus parakribbianus]
MYQLCTDSGCDLPQTLLDDHHVAAIPFHYSVNGTLMTDALGETHESDAVYAKLHAAEAVSTTQINVGEYHAFFAPFVAANVPVLYLGFSGALSGSLDSARQARALLLADHPGAVITIVDTLGASGGEGLLVLRAAALQAAGATLDEVATWVTTHRQFMHHWVTVDDLDHLVRGGRLPKAAAVIGGMLKIKPLLEIDATGRVKLSGKARSRKAALGKLVAAATAAYDADPQQTLMLATAGDWSATAAVATAIRAARPAVRLLIRPVSLTIACHTGYGCMAVFGLTATPRS